MGTDEALEKRKHLEQLITAKVDRLKELEVQEAHYGIDCPPPITNEARRLRQEMPGLRAQLELLRLANTSSVRHDRIAVPVRPAVVVVERNLDLLWIFRRAVAQTVGEACDVIALATGADACAQVALRPVPLIIVAEKLIDMEGIKVVAIIKERSPRTRIALTSNSPTLASEALAWRSGVNYYLKKPFALSDIDDIVRETLT
jgi:CheY-like chemotaxis protein